MYWYGPDFGTSDSEKLEFICKYAGKKHKEILRKWLDANEKIKLKYNKYDWTLNGSAPPPVSNTLTTTASTSASSSASKGNTNTYNFFA